MLNEGDEAPPFTLQDDTGKTVTLRDFEGKTVVLYFYPKDDTPGCTREACGFRDTLPSFRRKNAVILGVSADPVASHQKFKNKYDLPFPLLSDPERRTIEAYGVWKEKNLYGRKSMGIERTTFVIDPSGTIRKIFPRVKVDGHIEKVLETV